MYELVKKDGKNGWVTVRFTDTLQEARDAINKDNSLAIIYTKEAIAKHYPA